MTEDAETGCALRVSLVGSQAVTIAIDMRTGRIVLKDAGVLAASNRDGRFRSQAAQVNRWPYDLVLVILQLKYQVSPRPTSLTFDNRSIDTFLLQRR